MNTKAGERACGPWVGCCDFNQALGKKTTGLFTTTQWPLSGNAFSFWQTFLENQQKATQVENLWTS